MLNKSTEGHFVCVWLIVVLVTCTTCYTAASGCNTTTVLGFQYGWIVFPTNSGYCEMSLINTRSNYYDSKNITYKLSFSDFFLDCRSEYVEIWYFYPKRLLRHYCGHMRNKEVGIGKQKHVLVKYSVNSSLGERYRLYYSPNYDSNTGCKTTTKVKRRNVGYAAWIYFPPDCSYCEMSIITPDDFSFKLTFSNFSLDCRSEYVKIWYLYPRRLLRHYCGHMGNKEVRIEKKYAFVQYSANSTGLVHSDKRYWHYDNPPTQPDRSSHHRKRGIGTATIIGIIIGVLIGALVCGIGLAHRCGKPRRRRQRRRQPSVLQHMPVTPGLSKLPHLPNYFDNEGAVPPPYLESIGADGNSVYPPSCNDNPPPYSILDTESTLETTGDTRATDRLDQSR